MHLNDPIKSPAPIKIESGHKALKEVEYMGIKQFKSLASKERVSISNTNNTLWFQLLDQKELVGCCGLYLAKNKCRIKGDWILPQYRGKGFGEFITQCRLLIAKELEYDLIEVLTLHPHYYKKKGFTIYKETRKGVWLADKKI